MEYETLCHPFPALYAPDSRVLILGSFPSVKSREQRFFYGHPQNRFWRVMAALFDESVPQTIEEKRALLLSHRIALWDVIASCDISGSSDASIRDAVPNDLSPVFEAADIRCVFTNGGKAHELYQKYTLPLTSREDVRLPSTSPANAAYSLEKLTGEWQAVREALEN